MRRVVLTGLLAACRFDPQPLEQTGGTTPPDAFVADGCTSFSTYVDTCRLSFGAPLVLAGTLRYDTTSGILFDTVANQPVAVTSVKVATPAGDVEAIVASSITLSQTTVLRAAGPRPFAIIASGDVVFETNAVVDVSAGGAGARDSCGLTDPAPGANRDGGAGGGGGAGFGGVGGDGGSGNSDGTSAAGGRGGAAIVLPLGPLGGCAGEKGGDDNNDTGGAGGAGGGAVLVISGKRIAIATGSGIQAGGAGGKGGNQHGVFNGDAGGGGGGSGGMIILEAPAVTSQGTLAANGGGGGEGSGGVSGGDGGDPGQLATTRAAGGSDGSGSGTDGGEGGARDDVAGSAVTATSQGGAGGGGGGAGFIHIICPSPDAGTVSPLAQ